MAVFVPADVITDPDALSATVDTTGSGSRTAADEIHIDTANKLIYVAVDASNSMTVSGLTLKCLYSFLKDRWKADATLIKFPFPMTPITDEQFEFTNGWNLDKVDATGAKGGASASGATTVGLIRTGGWAVNAGPGTNDTERWFSFVSLGELDANDQVYYRQIDDTTSAPVQILLTGRVNQAIQFYSDTNADGTPDYNYATFFEAFVRTWSKTYADANLTDIGAESGVTYQAYRFPVANATDVKVSFSEAAASGDAVSITGGSHTAGTTTIVTAGHSFEVGDVIDIAGVTPTAYNVSGVTITAVTATDISYEQASDPGAYTSGGTVSGTYFNNMSISWANTSAVTAITGFNDNAPTSIPTAYFTVTIDADVGTLHEPNPTAEIIYQYVQAQLRKPSDINANTADTGIRRGDITPLKLQFVGDDLYTLGQPDVPGAQDYEGVYINNFATADQNRLHFWGYGSEVNSASAISTIARATNVVTVVTSTGHGLTTGDYVTISGVTPTTFNGTYAVTVTNTTTFTYSNTGADESGTVDASSTVAPAQFTDLTFPFVAILTLNFSATLVNDSDPIYRVFFTNDLAADSPAGNDYGTPNAIIVNDADDVPMAGAVTALEIQRSYAYDENVQRGAGSAGKDAPITAVAIGLENAQYISATTTIARNISNSVTLVAPLERNYDAGSV